MMHHCRLLTLPFTVQSRLPCTSQHMMQVAEVHVEGPHYWQQTATWAMTCSCFTISHDPPLQNAPSGFSRTYISAQLADHTVVQVAEVHVEGPRYWQQTLPGTFLRQGGSPGGPSVSQGAHTLYVRRKSGTMPYDEDPLGVRGLLSTTLHLVCP